MGMTESTPLVEDVLREEGIGEILSGVRAAAEEIDTLPRNLRLKQRSFLQCTILGPILDGNNLW